jgi:hypothetical protein
MKQQIVMAFLGAGIIASGTLWAHAVVRVDEIIE